MPSKGMDMAIASVSSLVSTGVGANAATGLAQAENAQKNPLAGFLQRNDASSKTQLSALGRTKLSLEDLQAAAQAAKNINNPPTLSDFKVAVQGVVQSLNALSSAARASESAQSTRTSSVTDQRANQALNQVRNALQENGGSQSLQRLGISRNEEGGFALNQRQLEASFQQDRPGSLSALFDVADRVETAADRALNETATPPARQSEAETEPDPTEETEVEKEQRKREVQRESFRELLASQLANTRSYVARNAVATYFSVSAL